MQHLSISRNTTLSDLADIVGERNVDYILNTNGLKRTVNIGEELYKDTPIQQIDVQSKITVLNSLVDNYDAFEKAALGDESDWYSLYMRGTFKNFIKVPDEIQLPQSVLVMGDDEPVADALYKACTKSLLEQGYVDPTLFSEYTVLPSGAFGVESTSTGSENPFQWFQLPWGKISLYSSIADDMVNFPVYPEGFSDGYSANYTTMPDMLYQYEPWQVYQSSGPRSNSYTFDMHRDMWSGDHRDGCANDLIRFCEANCFPSYDGAMVNTPTVTLYLNGNSHITGVLTSCKVDWDGPIGLDGFYLHFTLTLEITEVSKQPLNYNTVRTKGLQE